jgi:heme/copper-type cytochrome/quinol oxidase subunit 2
VLGAASLATGVASADAPVPWQWLFQDSATSTAQAQQDLHHDIMFFVISITTLVLYMLFNVSLGRGE